MTYGICCENDPRKRLAFDDWGRTLLFDTIEEAQECIDMNQNNYSNFKLYVKETKKKTKKRGNRYHFNWEYMGKYSPFSLEYKKKLESENPGKKVVAIEDDFSVSWNVK